MAILTVQSNNPNFSHILSKNPNTIREQKKPFQRDMRKGRIFGWFEGEKDDVFRLLFVDSQVESSFGKDSRAEFEYLDKTRYSNGYAYVMMITNALASASTKAHELDSSEYKTEVKFVLDINSGFANRISHSIPGTSIKKLNDYVHEITVQSNTVISALNIAQVIGLVSAIRYGTEIALKEDALTKYVNVMNRADAPYFIRYLFLSKAINNRHTFDKLKPLIDNDKFNLKFGNTQIQRHDEIKNALLSGIGERLIDIGCGEMFHSFKLAQLYTTVVGLDADAEVVSANKGRIEKRQIDNVVCIQQEVTAEYIKEHRDLFDGADVLLAEVLEHIPLQTSKDIVRALLETDCNKIVITVPCSEFNQYFGDDCSGDDWSRHEDHIWEPSRKEWLDFVVTHTPTSGWYSVTTNIGDAVKQNNGEEISLSMMTIFRKGVLNAG